MTIKICLPEDVRYEHRLKRKSPQLEFKLPLIKLSCIRKFQIHIKIKDNFINKNFIYYTNIFPKMTPERIEICCS